jgi:hypothetical protein
MMAGYSQLSEFLSTLGYKVQGKTAPASTVGKYDTPDFADDGAIITPIVC